jgi:lipase ATG15
MLQVSSIIYPLSKHVFIDERIRRRNRRFSYWTFRYIPIGQNISYWSSIELTPLGDFEYPPQNNMQYPTCRLFKGFQFPGGDSTGLADYAFLATMIYQAPETYVDTLDAWFGPGMGTVEWELVEEFRLTIAGGRAAVKYQVISFGEDLAVVVVRGSTSSWEWLTDAQLWGAVAWVQIVQTLLPAGVIFNPILEGVLRAMSVLESTELEQVALYQQTTALVNYVQQRKSFTKIHITGQSLGGGIALITGAQTNIPAIAISGPNNLFSRKTFDPPLNLETINSMLFNVIPERDVVPLVDSPGLLTQNIACRARRNDVFGCHTSTRSLCEILYKCGSYNRPPPCECAVKYGYPEAQQVAGNETYTDICGAKRSNEGWYA